MIKEIIQGIFQKFNIKLQKFSGSDLGRRILLIKGNNINKIIDVGANIGQYGIEIRKAGFKGEIISIEPLSEAFLKLKNKAKKDEKWHVYNFALGNLDGSSIINVSKNSVSSSINNIGETHLKAAPESQYIKKEEIFIKKLDSLFNDFYKQGDIIMLKIDTQGFEKDVLIGADNFLEKVILLQIEMSLTKLYENEVLFDDMIKYLKEKGFKLISLENGFYDKKSGQLFQVDGIFINEKLNNSYAKFN